MRTSANRGCARRSTRKEIEGANNDDIVLGSRQIEMIRKHLGLVFIHEIDPSAGPPDHQAKLNAAHAKKPTPSKDPPWDTELDPAAHVSGGPVFRC